MDSKVLIVCPHCEKKLRIPVAHSEKPITCPGCKETFLGHEGVDAYEVLKENVELKRMLAVFDQEVASTQTDSNNTKFANTPRKVPLTVVQIQRPTGEQSTEGLSLQDARECLSATLQKCQGPLNHNHGQLYSTAQDKIVVLFGAKNGAKNQGWRAIRFACKAMQNLQELQKTKSKYPAPVITVHTSEAIVGNIGGTTDGVFNAAGEALTYVDTMAELASSNRVYVSEGTLNFCLDNMPQDWGFKKGRTKSKSSDEGNTYTNQDLSAKYMDVVYLVGPGADKDKSHAEFFFRCALDAPAASDSTGNVLLTVTALKAATSGAVELSDDSLDEHQINKSFGKYTLQEMIGKGGMGEVWTAKDEFDNTIAIKTLRAGEEASDAQIQRFQREAKVLAKLPHPGICRIHEVGVADRTHYIAMELVDGEALGHFIKRGHLITSSQRRLVSKSTAPWPELFSEVRGFKLNTKSTPEQRKKLPYLVLPFGVTVSMMIKISEAIQFAHNNGILHRDLKPANILIRNNGESVVMDFGLAKMETGEDELSMSITGKIMGTIEYMAPEQARSTKDVDERADVFALGALLYQMTTGRKHFTLSGNILDDAHTLQTHDPEKPRALNAAIDKDLENIILKALKTEAEYRYQSVAEFCQDLQRYNNDEEVEARADNVLDVLSKVVRRNKAMTAVIGGAALLMIVGTLWFIINLQAERNALKKTLDQLSETQDARRKDQQLAAPSLVANANARIEQSDIKGAMDDCRMAINFDPSFPGAHRLKSYLHIHGKEYSDAVSSLRKLIDLGGANENDKKMFNLCKEAVARKWVDQPAGKLANLLIDEGQSYLAASLLKDHKALVGMFREKLQEKYKRYFSIRKDTHTLVVHIGRRGLKDKDLDMLRGAPVHILHIDGNSIGDISAIKGMPLEELRLGRTLVTNISVLADMPLHSLDISETPLSDISPLAKAPLKTLHLYGTKVSDISALKGMSLQSLSLSGSPVEDLSPLEGQPIEALQVQRIKAKIPDGLLQSLKLKQLNVGSNGYEDISFLKGLSITSLNISGNQVKSLKPLQSLKNLENLHMSWTRVRDISDLKGLKIKTLSMVGTAPRNPEILATLPNLEELQIEPKFLTKDIIDRMPKLVRLRAKDDKKGMSVDEFIQKHNIK